MVTELQVQEFVIFLQPVRHSKSCTNNYSPVSTHTLTHTDLPETELVLRSETLQGYIFIVVTQWSIYHQLLLTILYQCNVSHVPAYAAIH